MLNSAAARCKARPVCRARQRGCRPIAPGRSGCSAACRNTQRRSSILATPAQASAAHSRSSSPNGGHARSRGRCSEYAFWGFKSADELDRGTVGRPYQSYQLPFEAVQNYRICAVLERDGEERIIVLGAWPDVVGDVDQTQFTEYATDEILSRLQAYYRWFW